MIPKNSVYPKCNLFPVLWECVTYLVLTMHPFYSLSLYLSLTIWKGQLNTRTTTEMLVMPLFTNSAPIYRDEADFICQIVTNAVIIKCTKLLQIPARLKWYLLPSSNSFLKLLPRLNKVPNSTYITLVSLHTIS